MINDKYPVKSKEKAEFSFFWIKISTLGILAYYVLEMINRVFFFNTEIELPVTAVTWRIIDSSIYAAAFVILAIQAAFWRENLKAYENRKKARNAFFALFFAALFTALYEILVIKMEELEYSLRSDLSVPFLLMIITHFYGFNALKQIISKIGSSKKAETGRSFFYTLFALNPAIRFLLPFILMIFSSLGGGLHLVYLYYAELVMTYISAFIAGGVTVFIWIDSRKIKIAHLMESIPKDIDRQLEQAASEFQAMIKKSDVSEFCPSCGVKIYTDTDKCEKCGASIIVQQD